MRLLLYGQKNQVLETMPETFKTTYSSPRCIIHCAKIFCQKSSSLFPQSSLYSSYKHHVRYKGLFAITSSGVKCFLSELYAGCISKKKFSGKNSC